MLLRLLLSFSLFSSTRRFAAVRSQPCPPRDPEQYYPPHHVHAARLLVNDSVDSSPTMLLRLLLSFSLTLSIITHRSRAGLIFKGLHFVGDVRASAGQQREDFYRRQAFRDRQAAYQTAGGPFCHSSRPTFWSRGVGGWDS